jgi:hypothetical protein
MQDLQVVELKLRHTLAALDGLPSNLRLDPDDGSSMLLRRPDLPGAVLRAVNDLHRATVLLRDEASSQKFPAHFYSLRLKLRHSVFFGSTGKLDLKFHSVTVSAPDGTTEHAQKICTGSTDFIGTGIQ